MTTKKRRPQGKLNNLSRVFQANGYPHAVTAGILNKKWSPPPTSTEDNDQKLLVLPNVKGLSEKIRLVRCPLNITTAFRSSSTLRSLLTHVKAPTPEEQKCLVYRVPCKCGSVYVGDREADENLPWRARESCNESRPKQRCGRTCVEHRSQDPVGWDNKHRPWWRLVQGGSRKHCTLEAPMPWTLTLVSH